MLGEWNAQASGDLKVVAVLHHHPCTSTLPLLYHHHPEWYPNLSSRSLCSPDAAISSPFSTSPPPNLPVSPRIHDPPRLQQQVSSPRVRKGDFFATESSSAGHHRHGLCAFTSQYELWTILPVRLSYTVAGLNALPNSQNNYPYLACCYILR
ncbi:hypothetical protein MIND_01327100 [Mycena indigotica]|uniref:Uncharacterized protein n=1 Tax=Mycena indigotica TaxID=2126181 RepID=A0A8H6VVV2_9AGAR|nr:uncharacterized protein MIND_01327100 [Mycena indigotica]KAF7290139.1 hypothetical protein MIND_01327100 [Mycena indigotica]